MDRTRLYSATRATTEGIRLATRQAATPADLRSLASAAAVLMEAAGDLAEDLEAADPQQDWTRGLQLPAQLTDDRPLADLPNDCICGSYHTGPCSEDGL
jgi:hypothetical protein